MNFKKGDIVVFCQYKGIGLFHPQIYGHLVLKNQIRAANEIEVQAYKNKCTYYKLDPYDFTKFLPFNLSEVAFWANYSKD